ncbi:MAG TPA: hypothetical protein GXZ59_03300 [Clostridiaceae bacterium]|nr:hypothetical protein [Clostridiaceae bacterium]
MHVVFHIDEMDKWKLLLANVNNFLREVDDAVIEVVAYAEAVKYYVGQEPLPENLLGRVDFVACANALRGWEIEEDSLPAHVAVVPSGVVEIARKQEEGYAYIRP